MDFKNYLEEAFTNAQTNAQTNDVSLEKKEVIAFADQFSKAVRFAIICAWDNSYKGRVRGMIGNLLDSEFKRDNMIQSQTAKRAIELIQNYVKSNK